MFSYIYEVFKKLIVMENNIVENNNDTLSLLLSGKGFESLNELRKWTKFLSILGFIFLGLLVVLGFSMGSLMGYLESMTPQASTGMHDMPWAMFGFIYVFMALVYFFPLFYLFKFSSYAKIAIASKKTEDFNIAITYLKSHFKFIGIMTIVVLSFYVLAMVIGVVAAIAMSV